MTSKLIRDRAKKFVGSLKSLAGSDLVSACKIEIDNLREKYSITYVRSALTEYRKELDKQSVTTYKVKDIASNVSYLLRIDKAEQKAIKKSDKQRVKRQNKDLIHLPNPGALVDIAKELLNSGNVPKIAVGLCLLTGRRSSEIMKTAKFKKLGNSKNTLLFSGQLKKRGGADNYVIYALDNTAKECRIALKYIRANANAKKLTVEQTKTRYNPQINRACKHAYVELLGRKVAAHELRRIYGIIAASEHKRNDQSMPDFLSDILGHNAESMETALNYQKHYI